MTRRTFAFVGVALSLILVAMMTARQYRLGRDAMAMATLAHSRNDVRSAILFSETAAEAAAPGSPYPALGFGQLELIIRESQARGDETSALRAAHAMRAAAVSTSGILFDTREWKVKAEDTLLRSMAASSSPHPSSESLSWSMNEDLPPNPLPFFALFASAIVFVYGALRALGQHNPFRDKPKAILASSIGAVGIVIVAVYL